MVKEDIQKRYGVPSERIRVIRNGIDLERFNPAAAGKHRDAIRRKYGFDDEDFVCLFTAAPGRRKGLNELLESIKLIRNERVKLLIVGRTDKGSLAKQLSEHHLESRVAYAGFQPKIEEFYGASDCFVFPSKYDAAANVVCEALASGVPCITTRTNGSSELIEPGKNGFVVPQASDYAKICENIEHIVQLDPTRLSSMREHAMRIGMQFTMDRHIDAIEDVLFEYSNQRATPLKSGAEEAAL